MKQTSIEWLINELDLSNDGLTMRIINKAKEMEKKQIIDAGNSCALKQHLHVHKINNMTETELIQFAEEEHLTFGEDYYNEEFKKEQ